jgi:hypothetical protein
MPIGRQPLTTEGRTLAASLSLFNVVPGNNGSPGTVTRYAVVRAYGSTFAIPNLDALL